jgi:hypothetical protein
MRGQGFASLVAIVPAEHARTVPATIAGLRRWTDRTRTTLMEVTSSALL